MISSYTISGSFIESCDCFDLCPCWVADDPDEDHCTGLVAWSIDEGTIDGVSVAGARVAAVTSHNGQRRADGAFTVLFIDVPHGDQELTATLTEAFSGLMKGEPEDQSGQESNDESEHVYEPVPGPMGALARVTGTVLGTTRNAKIALVDKPRGRWELTIRSGADDPLAGATVHAEGGPAAFPDPPDAPDRDEDGNPTEPTLGAPLTLNGTALHAELQIKGEARAQHTTKLKMVVPALPGGYLSVTGRSGMRGTFCYEHGGVKAQA